MCHVFKCCPNVSHVRNIFRKRDIFRNISADTCQGNIYKKKECSKYQLLHKFNSNGLSVFMMFKFHTAGAHDPGNRATEIRNQSNEIQEQQFTKNIFPKIKYTINMRTKFFSKNNIGKSKMPFEIIQMLQLTKQIIPDYYNSTICSPFVLIFLVRWKLFLHS